MVVCEVWLGALWSVGVGWVMCIVVCARRSGAHAWYCAFLLAYMYNMCVWCTRKGVGLGNVDGYLY